MKLALIDIGSNTIRLLICEVIDDNKIKRIRHRRIVTRLADKIIQTQRLNRRGRNTTIRGLLSFLETCKSLNVNSIYAIATNAVREALDGKEFISEIKAKTGIGVDVISGEQEAELTYFGIKQFIDGFSNVAIFDIGGGSTEFICIEGADIIRKSIPIGVVKLKDLFIKHTPTDDTTITQIQNHITSLIEGEKIVDYRPQRLFITGGTATTLACIDKKIKRYNPDLVHLHSIGVETLDSLIEKFSVMTKYEISRVIGVDSKRADIILPGILIIKNILLAFNLQDFVVSDYGLLEGLAFKMMTGIKQRSALK